MRILLVEDDAALSQAMTRSLEQSGHRVELARSVEEADHWWRVQEFDAVLLDLNLPVSTHELSGRGSGLSALRAARARGDRTPVLVLTARDRTEERIAGLDAGADDYLGKPFDLGEVEARLRALLRRASGSTDRVEFGELVLDRRAKKFLLSGQGWELPTREFEVLAELMSPPGRVVSKREMSRKLSDADVLLGDNALEAFISRLRRKLAGTSVAIRTLRGLGYVLEEDASRKATSGQAGD